MPALYLDDGAEPLAVCLILQLLMNVCCRPSSWEAWSAARQLSGACMQPHPVSQSGGYASGSCLLQMKPPACNKHCRPSIWETWHVARQKRAQAKLTCCPVLILQCWAECDQQVC